MKKKTKLKQSNFKIAEVVFLVLTTCILSLSSGMFLQYKLFDKPGNEQAVVEKSDDSALEDFIDNYKNIVDNYYDEVNKEELIREAIKGMVNSLEDPYSVYMDEEEGSSFNILLSGSYVGVGIQIVDNLNDEIVIIKVFEGSPAAKAGLKPNDVITKINDMSLDGKVSTELTDYIKGNKSGDFNITYIRDGEENTVSLSKDLISIKSVTSKVYKENDKKIGYLGVSIFASNTYEQFRNELEKLEAANIDSLIIDLRNNSGGHLTTVKNMISLFLDASNVIYQTEGKQGVEKFYSSGTETKEYPIIILSNKASASASEVMMGALGDRYGAFIIGESSFGKGTVQEMQSVSGGGQYKITTKKWLTPSGYWVQDKGIKPDAEVSLTTKYFENPTEENDNQLQSAINLLKE